MKILGQNPAKAAELSGGKAREADQQTARKNAHLEEGLGQVQHQTTLVTQKLKQAVQNEPDIRVDRVADLKARIQSGKFQVDSERLAGNILLDSLREDLERP